MKRFGFVLAGLVVLAGQSQGLAQNDGTGPEEYEVTADAGPWMILTTSYSGPEGRDMARKLVMELRKYYQLPAYIYNFTNPEKEKEKKRIEELIRERRKQYELLKLPPDTPLHIRTHRFQDQYGVLVGGYKDMDTASSELKNKIKKLPLPDPKRVPLASIGISNPVQKVVERAWVNPFKDAFVVRNPKVRYQPPPKENKPDPDLAKYNEGEDFNLLKCPKRFTLAVAQFHSSSVLQTPLGTTNTMKKLFGTEEAWAATRGAAAVNAHNVAEFLRTLNFKAYVLHMRYVSIVTVGNYDAPDDPELKAKQQLLAKLKLDPLPMLPQSLPMAIPRP
jgi:hypothetical protein